MTSRTVGPGMATRIAEASAKASQCSSGMSVPVGERFPREEPAQHGLEGREGHGVVIRIEGVLVPFLAEGGRPLEHRMAAVALAFVAVHPDMVIVVVALEHRVVLDQPVIVRGDIGPQDGGAELGMVFRRQGVADIVEEGADHRLLIGAVTEGPACRLQRMLVAVDLVADLVARQAIQHTDDLVGQALYQWFIKTREKLVLLIGSIGHAREIDRFFHALYSYAAARSLSVGGV